MVEIRTAAEQLAAEQQERAVTATRVEDLVGELEQRLGSLAELAGTNVTNGGAVAPGRALEAVPVGGNSSAPHEALDEP